MKMLKVFFALVLLIVGFGANAGLFGPSEFDGMGSKCMEKHSKAWCVWDAAEISKGVKDFDGKSLADSFSKKPDSGTVDVSMALLDTQNFMRLKTDVFGMHGDVGMILLNALMHSKPLALNSNRIFSWMPIEMAKNPEEAGALMESILLNATKSAMDGKLINEVKSNISEKKDLYTWEVVGGDCDKVKCTMSNIYEVEYVNKVIRIPSKGKAPAWMGEYDAWVFDKSSGTMPYELVINGVRSTPTYITELSKKLPSWVFVSICPELMFYGKAYNKGVTVPFVFNQGEPFAPVFPEVKIKN